MISMRYSCRTCGENKDLSEFRPSGNKLGHDTECRKCFNRRMREYYRSRPEQYEKHRKYVSKNDQMYKNVWYSHGMTKEEFDERMARYDGRCWSCKVNRATDVDHDHSCCPTRASGRLKTCGKCFRGMLCNGCNSALGHAKDSVDRLEALIEYLNSTQLPLG